MIFRDATHGDWEAVAALHELSVVSRGVAQRVYGRAGDRESQRERWRTRLADPAENQFVLLALNDDGTLAGFACAYGEHHEEWGMLLDNLHVRPELHRNGVGRELMRRAAAWCVVQYPESGMYLEVLEANDRARRFYERLGGDDAKGSTWDAPDGTRAAVRYYVWTAGRVRELAEGARE